MTTAESSLIFTVQVDQTVLETHRHAIFHHDGMTLCMNSKLGVELVLSLNGDIQVMGIDAYILVA